VTEPTVHQTAKLSLLFTVSLSPGQGGGFLYKLGVVSYTIRILHVSCMYLACILKDTCIPNVS